MGSEQVSGGADLLWFEYFGSTVEGDPCSGADHAFLAALRARAVSQAWPCDPADTFANHDDEMGAYALRLGVWLDDPVENRVLIAFGLVFDGKRIIGDRIDYEEPFYFEGRSEAAMELSGSPKELAQRAGEWFERLLTWPIERREWFKRGKVVYREWVFSHTEETLYRFASGRSRPAGPPDRVVLVRGTRDR